ncbi:MAG: hypothetical protein KCHDKBKB_01850 [Elusimicrobia bacterium]|nr:hypothetical protein [Elusimicrobiota bacterium]
MPSMFESHLTLIFIGFFVVIGFVYGLLRHQQKSSLTRLEELNRQLLEAQQKANPAVEFLQREISNLREQMTTSLAESAKLVVESQKTVGERLDKAAQVVGQVQNTLGGLDRATQQVFAVGKDISQLQEILRAPKMRGTLGELFLADLLSQILPPKHFKLQHTFKTGETVDAVIFLGGKYVPVDSKFPLENFKRLLQTQDPAEKTVARRKFVNDVKRHIDSIASKYLLPDENTFDFALMYIPAENVYYETIIKDDAMGDDGALMNYAFSKRVVPVSPNSFFAYLHTIALGLKGLQIEENALLIIDQLARLRGDFSRFKDDFRLIGKHLTNAKGSFEDSEKRLGRFEDKLLATGEKKNDLIESVISRPESGLPLDL